MAGRLPTPMELFAACVQAYAAAGRTYAECARDNHDLHVEALAHWGYYSALGEIRRRKGPKVFFV